MYTINNRMNNPNRNNYLKITAVISTLFISVFLLAAQVLAAEELSAKQKEARAYRAEGVKHQNAGDLTAASSYYQRATTVDPFYAVAYNDLGIIYEAQGNTEQAKQLYLKAIELEPNFLSAYTNLALVYEQERDLNKAAYYWRKRAELGNLQDSWTIRAISRLADIEAVLYAEPVKEGRERQAAELSRKIKAEKSFLVDGDNEQANKALAKKYFARAKRFYKEGKELAAFKVASEANYLDPSDAKIQEFMGKISTKILSQ
ncbi:MAG: tetratricopeptide repeat protein [Candidatus Omnitrophota bacterium]